MVKQQETIKKLFNTISDDYDRMNNIISLNNHKRWRRQLNHTIKTNEKMEVLDIATGTADWAISIAPKVKKVVGLDYSDLMLEKAQIKIQNAKLQKKISLVQADAMKMPLDDDSFDLVTIGFGLRNLPNPIKGLKEIHRVLKPGGQLVILETSQVENKLIRPFWQFYMHQIIPIFGGIFSGHTKEYIYLHQSTDKFLTKDQLKAELEKNNFTNVSYQVFQLGAVAAHLAIKK